MSRQHWVEYYMKKYNKNPNNTQACIMAMWYLFLIESES